MKVLISRVTTAWKTSGTRNLFWIITGYAGPDCVERELAERAAAPAGGRTGFAILGDHDGIGRTQNLPSAAQRIVNFLDEEDLCPNQANAEGVYNGDVPVSAAWPADGTTVDDINLVVDIAD